MSWYNHQKITGGGLLSILADMASNMTCAFHHRRTNKHAKCCHRHSRSLHPQNSRECIVESNAFLQWRVVTSGVRTYSLMNFDSSPDLNFPNFSATQCIYIKRFLWPILWRFKSLKSYPLIGRHQRIFLSVGTLLVDLDDDYSSYSFPA